MVTLSLNINLTVNLRQKKLRETVLKTVEVRK